VFFRKKSLLDLHEQVGQMLLMGFDGTEADNRLLGTLATLEPGGIILFARNITSAQQTWELLQACRKVVRTRMFLCVDMEGGTVDRLKNAIAPAPSAAAVFASGNKKLFRKHGRVIGEEVRAVGFNVDFAPVSDLAFEISKPVLGSRTVSPDPEETSTYVSEFLRGLRDSGVLGCGKHFPGLGEASLDTHKELPKITKSWRDLWEQDLYPYRKLHRQFDFVMVAHGSYPRVGDPRPASLSRKWISDILRKKIGYKGLIMADDLEMGGVLAAASIEEAAIETVRAGSDIFPICHNEEAVWRCYTAVLREAERDSKLRRRVHESSARIINFKRKRRELRTFSPPLSRKTVDRLRNKVESFAREVASA